MKTIKIIVTNTEMTDKDAIKSIERLQANLMLKYWDKFYKSKYGNVNDAIVQEGDVFYLFNDNESKISNQLHDILIKINNPALVNFEIDVINNSQNLESKLNEVLSTSYFTIKAA